MTDTDRAAGVRLLRMLRESRGWSWADLARALREVARLLSVDSLADVHVASVQRTVARWESPTGRTVPSDWYQYLLAHLYARTPGGMLALGAGSDFDTLRTAFGHLGMQPQHLTELYRLVTRTATSNGGELLALLSPATHAGVADVLRDPSSLDIELIDGLAHAVMNIDQQIGTTPFVRLQIMLAPVVETCRRLVRTDPRPPLHDELSGVATDAFALAGRLAFETRDDAAATTFYREANIAAGELPDPQRQAVVRTSHTMVTFYTTGDLEAARRLAAAAVRDAERGPNYAVRARALAVHAEICARAGNADQARTALEKAWKTVDHIGSGDSPRSFNADRLNGFEGVCALHIGQADRAEDRLHRSVATLNQPRDAVQRGIVGTDLALARLRLGDPQASAGLLHVTVDITSGTGGRVSAQRIRHVRRELRPWRGEAFVAELDDHIHDTLLGR